MIMFFRTTAVMAFVLFMIGGSLAQQAAIKIEAMSPGRLHHLGLTGSTTTGLSVVPKGGVVYMSDRDLAGGTINSCVWQMTSKPGGSLADLDSTLTHWTTFRPDMTGQYAIKLTITTATGTDDTTITITAANFTGVGSVGNVPPNIAQGQCAGCHSGSIPSLADKVTPWKTSGHAAMFQRGVDGIVSSHYSSSCMSCHTTGLDTDPLAVNNGFDDQMTSSGWLFPSTLQPGNFDTLVANHPQLAQVGTIGCEMCHGPGNQHFGNAAKTAVSIDIGACAACHDEPWRHNKVSEYENSKHAELIWSSSFRQQPSSSDFMTNSLNNCIRCHDGQAFINYTNEVGTDTRSITSVQNLTCAACHEPHGTPNAYQLRKISVDTLANGLAIPSTVGSGGVCMNCHKSRRDGETYPITTSISSHFGPHHSPQTDMYLGKNAHSFGQSIPSSIAHSLVQDACVGCHMSATVDTGSVARDKIGGHSWGMTYREPGVEIDNVSGCVGCHTGITHFRDIIAAFDYDNDGTIEPFINETHGLRALLAEALPPFGVDSVDWRMIQASPDSVRLKKAYYNYEFFEGDASEGIHNPKYAIGVLQRSVSILTGVEFREANGVPEVFALHQNYPNPFNPTTTISFAIPRQATVRLEVYDLVGRLVKVLANEELPQGNYSAVWDGTNVAGTGVSSGIYLYRIQAGTFVSVKKMVLLR